MVPVLYLKRVHGKLWSDRRSRGRYQFIAQVNFLLRGWKGPVPCAFVLLCLPPPHTPFPCHAWLCSTFFHSRAPIHGIPACASTVPRHVVLQFSTASLMPAFVPTSPAGPGSSGEQSTGAKIMPTFLHVLSRDSPARLFNNKQAD